MSPSDSGNKHRNPSESEDLGEEEGFELNELRDEHVEDTQPGAEQASEDEEDGDDTLLARPHTYTLEEEETVKRKLDRNLVLFVALLYMMSFLDRGNLGNAKLAGLPTSLSLTPSQFPHLLTAFYTTYILFQPLSHLYTHLPAHKHLTCIVLAWGIIASLQSLCTSFLPLFFLRLALGVAEAAFAGIPIYLSFFFRREELAQRMGIFIAAAPLASSFAGALAAGILAIGDKLPIESWRLLFLLEGFPAVLISVVVYYRIPDTPESAVWLSRRERKIARWRLHNLEKKGNVKVDWKAMLSPLLDPKAYLTASLLFAVNVSFSSISVFLPTILSAIGFTPLLSQALTAPPYLLSIAFILLTSYLTSSHSLPLIFHSLLSLTGFLILLTSPSSIWLRYLAIFPITSGLFTCVALIITWNLNNEDSREGKGTGFAILQIFGQCGSLVGAGMFPDEEGPRFGRGMAGCAVAMVWVGVGSAGLRWWLGRRNRERREGEVRFML